MCPKQSVDCDRVFLTRYFGGKTMGAGQQQRRRKRNGRTKRWNSLELIYILRNYRDQNIFVPKVPSGYRIAYDGRSISTSNRAFYDGFQHHSGLSIS